MVGALLMGFALTTNATGSDQNDFLETALSLRNLYSHTTYEVEGREIIPIRNLQVIGRDGDQISYQIIPPMLQSRESLEGITLETFEGIVFEINGIEYVEQVRDGFRVEVLSAPGVVAVSRELPGVFREVRVSEGVASPCEQIRYSHIDGRGWVEVHRGPFPGSAIDFAPFYPNNHAGLIARHAGVSRDNLVPTTDEGVWIDRRSETHETRIREVDSAVPILVEFVRLGNEQRGFSTREFQGCADFNGFCMPTEAAYHEHASGGRLEASTIIAGIEIAEIDEEEFFDRLRSFGYESSNAGQ